MRAAWPRDEAKAKRRPSSRSETAASALAEIWDAGGADSAILDSVTIEGSGANVLPGPFDLGAVASATIAASHLAAGLVAGASARVRISRSDAAAAFLSERFCRVEGEKPEPMWAPLSGFYEVADGHVQLHTNYPHHRDAVLRACSVPDDRAAVEAALRTWRAVDVEDAVLAEGGVASAYRTPELWAATEQARVIADLPLFDIVRLGEGPVGVSDHVVSPRRPLAGVRVLDLTHVIAGPIATRTLAAYGASVTRVLAPHLPTLRSLDIDTGFGKTWSGLDLRAYNQRAEFLRLVRDADVVVQGFRPGAFDRLGLGPQDLAAANPSIVVVTLSAWSHEGPWAGRRGYDSLVQTATGIASEMSAAHGSAGPMHLPAASLDHATGYLMATGASLAWARQRREGGAWHVRCSLAQTARWISGQPRVAADGPTPRAADVAHLLRSDVTDYGAVRHLGPVGTIDGADLRWDCGPPLRP
jgi:CoA-transferase family III